MLVSQYGMGQGVSVIQRPPNPSLQRTRLRRAVTGRSHSQAFGFATVRDYHCRAAEPNY
jgi:hypothetical protein